MHFQKSPFAESKLITCTEGVVFDVIVDIQRNSSTFGQHKSYILGGNQVYNSIFIPSGFAHGYLTLTPKSSLIYFMDMNFNESHAFGFAWDDKEVGIDWPFTPRIISKRDRSLGKLKTIS
jgi:dTDP-4-dehydrorhamnose 3,5-epimerase